MRLKWFKTSEFDAKPYHLPEFRKNAQTSVRLQRLTTTKPPKSTESALTRAYIIYARPICHENAQ